MTQVKTSGAICWPEQYPGEYEDTKKVWARADKRWPDREVSCTWECRDSYYPCRHCPKCKRFVSDIHMYGGELGGMLAVLGTCKEHGLVCVDSHNWAPEYFEGDDG